MTARGCGCCDCRADAISFASDIFTPKIIAFHRRSYQLVTIVQETFGDYDKDDRRVSGYRDYETVSETTEDVEEEFTTKPDFIIAGTLHAASSDIYRYETYKEEKNEDTGITRKFFRRTISKMVDGTEEIKCAAEIDVSQVFLFGKKVDDKDRIRSFFQDLSYSFRLRTPTGSPLFAPPEKPNFHSGANVKLSLTQPSYPALVEEDSARIDVGMQMDEVLPEDEEGFDSIHKGHGISWFNKDENRRFYPNREIDLLPVLPDEGKYDTAVLTFFSQEKGTGYQSTGPVVLSSHDFVGARRGAAGGYLDPNIDIGKGDIEERRLIAIVPPESPEIPDFPSGLDFYLSKPHNWSREWDRISDEEYITKKPLKSNTVISLNNIVSSDFWNVHGDEVYSDQDKKLVVEFINSETDKTVAKQEFFVRPWANRLDDFRGAYDGVKGSLISDKVVFDWTEGTESFRKHDAFRNDDLIFRYMGHLASGDDLSDLSNCSNPFINNSYNPVLAQAYGNFHLGDIFEHSDYKWIGANYTPAMGQVFATDGSSISCIDGSLTTTPGGLLVTLVDPAKFVFAFYSDQWNHPFGKYGITVPDNLLFGSEQDNSGTGVLSGCYDPIDGYYEWLLSSEGSWGEIDHFSAKETWSSIRTVDDIDSVSDIAGSIKEKFGEDKSLMVAYPKFSFGIPKRSDKKDRLSNYLSAFLSQRETTINSITLCNRSFQGFQVVRDQSELTTLRDFIVYSIGNADFFSQTKGLSDADGVFLQNSDLVDAIGSTEIKGTMDINYPSSDVVFPFSNLYLQENKYARRTGPGKFRIRDNIVDLQNCRAGYSSYDWKHIETDHDGAPLHVKFKIESKDPRPESVFTYDIKDIDAEKNMKCDEHGCSTIHPYNTIDFKVKSTSMGSMFPRDVTSESKNGCKSVITHGSITDVHENIDSYGGIIYDEYATEKLTYFQPEGIEDFYPPVLEDVLTGDARHEGPENLTIGLVYPFDDSICGDTASGIVPDGPSGGYYVDDSDAEKEQIGFLLSFEGFFEDEPPYRYAKILTGVDAKFPSGGSEKPSPYSGKGRNFTLEVKSTMQSQRIESVSDYSLNQKYSMQTTVEVFPYDAEDTEEEGEDSAEKVKVDVECRLVYPVGEFQSSSYDFNKLPSFSSSFSSLTNFINTTGQRFFDRRFDRFHAGSFGEIDALTINEIKAAEIQAFIESHADPILFGKYDRTVINHMNYCLDLGNGVEECTTPGGFPYVKRYDTFVESGVFSTKWFSDELALSDFWTGSIQKSISVSAVDPRDPDRFAYLIRSKSSTDGSERDYSGTRLEMSIDGRYHFVNRGGEYRSSPFLLQSNHPAEGGSRKDFYTELINDKTIRMQTYTLRWSRVVDKWKDNEIPDLNFSVGDEFFLGDSDRIQDFEVLSGINFQVTSSEGSGSDNRELVSGSGYPAVGRRTAFGSSNLFPESFYRFPWGHTNSDHRMYGDAFKWRGSYSYSDFPISQFQITIGGPDQ